jgi:hypothetical protein
MFYRKHFTVILNVMLLIVIILSVNMLNIIRLIVIMLGVITLNVITVNVMAPLVGEYSTVKVRHLEVLHFSRLLLYPSTFDYAC